MLPRVARACIPVTAGNKHTNCCSDCALIASETCICGVRAKSNCVICGVPDPINLKKGGLVMTHHRGHHRGPRSSPSLAWFCSRSPRQFPVPCRGSPPPTPSCRQPSRATYGRSSTATRPSPTVPGRHPFARCRACISDLSLSIGSALRGQLKGDEEALELPTQGHRRRSGVNMHSTHGVVHD
jgi:hypothetical protein